VNEIESNWLRERDGEVKEQREWSLRVIHDRGDLAIGAHVASHFKATEVDIYPTTHRVR
jgi:hypothetical protein